MLWQGSLIAGVAAGFSLYRAVAHPASTLFGPTIHRGKAGAMQVALTFDDGPDPVWTLRLAAALREHGAPATFFCIGERAKQYPEIARKLIEAGHEVGNHSYSHPNLWFRTSRVVRDQLCRSQEIVSVATGVTPKVFRPPFGDRGPQVLREARTLGLATVLWSLSSEDWNNPESSWIVERILRRVRDGEILLFHDASHDNRFPDRQATLEAVSVLVPALKERGFHFVTVSTMIPSYREAA